MLAGCLGPDHPSDDTLSLRHAQVVGTHNSYHVETSPLSAWEYTHAPLYEQLAEQGVRQFELDLFIEDDEWRAFHVPIIDAGSTCRSLERCLAHLVRGSEALSRAHLPVVVLLEVKQRFDEASPERLEALDQLLIDTLGPEHLLTPADLGGESVDMTAVMGDGWPPLLGQRGRFIPVLHEGGDWRNLALEQPPTAMFLDGYGDLSVPWAAIHSMNDPTSPRIAEVVGAGHLVRTRADVDSRQARENDPTRRDQALDSGAHFISTDWPAPHPDTGYIVEMPGGTPARCNPATAPDECAPELLEDPDRVF